MFNDSVRVLHEEVTQLLGNRKPRATLASHQNEARKLRLKFLELQAKGDVPLHFEFSLGGRELVSGV